jgi:hypothetical protein
VRTGCWSKTGAVAHVSDNRSCLVECITMDPDPLLEINDEWFARSALNTPKQAAFSSCRTAHALPIVSETGT